MGLSQDLAAAFQLILAQQEAEVRKEERGQNLALNLLSMEMRETEQAQSVLLKEYYDKKEEVAKTEKMFDKYRAMDPTYKSPGGMDMVNIVDDQNKIDMSAVTENLDILSNRKTELEISLNSLAAQGQKLKELQSEFWGANRILQEGEYEQFQEFATTPKTEIFTLPSGQEVHGLGWDTTAGADIDFYKVEPTAREDLAYKMTERYTKEAETGAAGSYAVLQSIFTLGEKEDSGDLVNRLTYTDASGKEVEPSEDIISIIQSMAGQNINYDDFLTNLNAYPAGKGGDVIREFLESNPNTAMIYNNLKEHAGIVNALDNELSGINDRGQATDLENFVSSISDISDRNILFGLYDQAVSGKDPKDHAQFFSAIEAQIGVEDAGAEYMKYKGFTDPNEELEDKDVGSLIPSQKELALSSLASINQDIAADSTYLAEYDATIDSLNKVQDFSYDRFLELAKLDPDNVDPWLLPSRARLVWWGMVNPSNDIEEEISRLGGDYRGASGAIGQLPLRKPLTRDLERNRAKRLEIEKTLQLLEGTD